MGKVIDIRKINNGEQSFVVCPCSPDGGTLIPVVVHDKSGPIIVCLVCEQCDKSIDVVNGILQDGD